MKQIRQGIDSLIDDSVVPILNRACGCGGTGWRRAAYLNMSDPTQTCPPAWELITTPRRSCARPSIASYHSCYSAMFPTQGIQYSQVCGRIIGYQFGSPSAFDNERLTINEAYVEGVSITHGRNPCKHIWSYMHAAGSSEQNGCSHSKCPCVSIGGHEPPSYVGNNYYCESAYRGDCFIRNTFFPNDPLWDGQQCDNEGTHFSSIVTYM